MSDEGMHGTGSRFMPLSQNMPDDISPRMVPVAGMYPGVTGEELMAPPSSPSAPMGMWQFDFSDPDGPQLGTVVLPPSAAVQKAADPVVMVAQSTELKLSLRNDVEAEVLIVIDRGELDFDSTKGHPGEGTAPKKGKRTMKDPRRKVRIPRARRDFLPEGSNF